ncbi:MAG: NERD domain-containing protein, partial [Tissierellia bacterium]|nr:NERD domain-containing protein [Tissierellia bacterium]
MILPINHFNGNSVAENIIWKKFRDFIPEDFVSFHNYYIGIRQPDIILLVPNKGILIIEIKGYYAKNILDVPDNSIIRFKNKPNEPSPFSQAITYRNILINDFLKPNSLESIFVTCAVCYPYITKEEYVSKGLNKISHERLTITADDLESQCTLLNKIEDVFNLLYEHVHHIDLDRYGFNRDLVEKTGNIISPNFRIDICEDAENKDEIEEYEQLVKSEEIEDMIEDVSERKFYSRLLYVKDSSRFQEDEINGLMHQWKLGTNIYFYTSDSSLLGSVLERVQNLLRELALEDKEYFEFKGNKTFLFNSGLISELDVELDILNGENYGKYSH